LNEKQSVAGRNSPSLPSPEHVFFFRDAPDAYCIFLVLLIADDGTVAEVTATRGTFSTLSPELVLSQSSNSDHEADGGTDLVLNREHHVREVGSQLCKKSDDPEYQFAIGSQPFSCPSDSQDSVHTLHLRLDVKETRSPVLFGLATGPPYHDPHMQLAISRLKHENSWILAVY
jgi:hypothetical protein